MPDMFLEGKQDPRSAAVDIKAFKEKVEASRALAQSREEVWGEAP